MNHFSGSLYLSSILLVLANLAVHRPDSRPAFFYIGALFAVGLLGGLMFYPPVFLLYIWLIVAMVPWLAVAATRKGPPPRPWLYLPVSVVATLIAFAGPVSRAVSDEWEYARLRTEFPFESLEGRMPPAPATAPAAGTESRVEKDLGYIGGGARATYLRLLHSSTTYLFVRSPGFGIGRMGSPPSPKELRESLRQGDPILQPAGPSSSRLLSKEGQWERRPADDGLLRTLEDSVIDFANPDRFGLVEGRDRVAGFQPHRFSKVPTMPEPLTVRRVELIGLLKHAEPVAYVSDHLPRMDELRDAPTRPLDAFEAEAVGRLHKGENLVVATAAQHTRMVGAIRSVHQCVECHGGERGGLLGAFSYTLAGR